MDYMRVNVEMPLSTWDLAIDLAKRAAMVKAINEVQGKVLDGILKGLDCDCPLHAGAYSAQNHNASCPYGRAVNAFHDYIEDINTEEIANDAGKNARWKCAQCGHPDNTEQELNKG